MTRPSRAALALLVSSQLACSSVTDSASDDVAGSPSEPAATSRGVETLDYAQAPGVRNARSTYVPALSSSS